MKVVALVTSEPSEGGGRGGAARYDVAERLRAAVGHTADVRLAPSFDQALAAHVDLLVIVSSAEVSVKRTTRGLWDEVRRVTADSSLPVLVVADRWHDQDERRALESGATGYLAFDLPSAVLDRSIRAALSGEVVFRRRTLGRWLRPSASEADRIPTLPELSRRQREVAVLIATGAADKEIAVRLGIRVGTVQKHVSKLLRTIGASNRAAAVWLVLGGTRLGNPDRA